MSDGAVSQRNAMLDESETLITHNAPDSADYLLDMCIRPPFSDKTTPESITQRVRNDRIWIAETKGDLNSAETTLKQIPASTPDKDDANSMRTAELRARLALMKGDYSESLRHSEVFDTHDDQIPKDAGRRSFGYSLTPDEQFTDKYQLAIMDRANALFHLGRFTDSERLLRKLIVDTSSQVQAQALICLAYCYSRTSHAGLAHACLAETLSKLESAPFQRIASANTDTFLKLALLEATDNNPVRSERYRAKARAIAEKAGLQNTQLYRDILNEKPAS